MGGCEASEGGGEEEGRPGKEALICFAPLCPTRQEMVDEKGLDPAAADKIGEMVVLRCVWHVMFSSFPLAPITQERAIEGMLDRAVDARLLMAYPCLALRLTLAISVALLSRSQG
jgi:hypothetical protein